jgi:hypothetical protein
MFQNPNGFNLLDKQQEFRFFIYNCANLRAGYISIAERNINWTQPCHICIAHKNTITHQSHNPLLILLLI